MLFLLALKFLGIHAAEGGKRGTSSFKVGISSFQEQLSYILMIALSEPSLWFVAVLIMETTDYFLRFPNFQRKSTVSLSSEFSLLAQQMKWKNGSKKYKSEWSHFLSSEFNIHYGSHATKLENWQALCIELGICHSIESISKCRKVGSSDAQPVILLCFTKLTSQALGNIYVNLVDLVNSRRTGQKVEHFPNVTTLRKYTRETNKIFPRSAAKEDGFLKALLRVIY